MSNASFLLTPASLEPLLHSSMVDLTNRAKILKKLTPSCSVAPAARERVFKFAPARRLSVIVFRAVTCDIPNFNTWQGCRLLPGRAAEFRQPGLTSLEHPSHSGWQPAGRVRTAAEHAGDASPCQWPAGPGRRRPGGDAATVTASSPAWNAQRVSTASHGRFRVRVRSSESSSSSSSTTSSSARPLRCHARPASFTSRRAGMQLSHVALLII